MRAASQILSEETIGELWQVYMKIHGSATESELFAIVRAAEDAVVHLTLFEMALTGQASLQLGKDGHTVKFRRAANLAANPEHIAPIIRRVLGEIGSLR